LVVGALFGLLSLLGGFAAACSGGSGKHQAAPTTTQPAVVATPHGDISVAAEQQPNCMDWLSACANSRWGVYMVEANTLPRAYDIGPDGTYRPSALLAGEATVATPRPGVGGPPLVVMYVINPLAVWSDHTPITSTDFQYTWQQVVNATDPIDKTGYNQIASIATTTPSTAVVTFSKPFAGWKSLFGGAYALLPSHLLANANRTQAMSAGYKFSGGPWMLDHWTKGSEIKLVANPAYWGKKPNLDSVTFKIVQDLKTEVQALSSGQMVAAYPEPQFALASLKGQGGTTVDSVGGLSIEGLWFNTQKAPLDHAAVRQALAYATDRNALVAQTFASVQPGIQALQSFYTPVYGKAYTTPFARYTSNPNMVNQLMTGDGWAKGADGIWAKGALRAALELKTVAGDTRRALTTQILSSQWAQAGFQLTVVQEPASSLAGVDLPGGNFQVALYDRAPTTLDLSQCALWCSSGGGASAGTSGGGASAAAGSAGTSGAGASGRNIDRISDPNLDRLWQDVDTNLNPTARLASASQAQSTLADLVPALPLAALPDILVVKSDAIATERGTFQHNPVYGPFASVNDWYIRHP
jgi:peptide/nickel transport system substrate-binding protein